MSSPALPAPVERAISAVNRGDTSGFLDAFTDSGVVNDWGREFRGREAIKGWSDKEFIGADARLTVDRVQPEGDTVTVTAQVKSSGFNGPSDFAFTLDGDKVREMRITD